MQSISEGPDGVDAGAEEEEVTEAIWDDTAVVVAPARLTELVTPPARELLTAAP